MIDVQRWVDAARVLERHSPELEEATLALIERLAVSLAKANDNAAIDESSK